MSLAESNDPFDRQMQSVKCFISLQTSSQQRRMIITCTCLSLELPKLLKKRLGGRRFNLQNSFVHLKTTRRIDLSQIFMEKEFFRY